MSNQKLRAVSLAVLLSLTLSLVFPVGVLADDAPPPSPEATEVAAPPEEVPTEEVPAEEGLAVDAVASESPDTEEPAVPEAEIQDTSEDTASDANAAPLLDQLPEGTDVVVLNENGDVVPLASQEAAGILALPDPQFCPTGFLPGASECGQIRTTIQAAVNDAKAAGIPGTVYIQSGTFNEIVTIADFANALTLQGVFSLAPYTVLTDPANRPVINGRILIQDGADSGTTGNTANITLIDLIINNSDTTTGDDAAIYADQNTADLTLINLDINAATNSNGGLMIQNHSGNVFLTGVDASGTDEYGASINNTAGSGNVTVTGSVFSGNDTDGLRIYSDGNVDLDNVTADTNTGNGVYIENQTSTTNADVTLTGTNSFVGNTYNGLYIRSKGDITLSNITANGSVNDSGVWLDNDETGANGGVIITGTNNVFSGNNDYGLVIDSRGAITLANIIANGNKTEDGVNIENCNWSGSACLGSGDVTLTGILQFTNNGNDDDGLVISSGGNVTMADVTATDNKDEGVEINNTGSATGAIVQVLGTNVFTGNTGDGLNIRSDGNITLNNVTADTNKDNGIDIDNTYGNTNATFTVTGTNNSFSGNTNNGMNVLSEGAITASNLTANGNTLGTGAYLMNDYAGAGGVIITGINVFNANYNSGLVIDSRGVVSLNSVTANSNVRGDGVNIDNCSWGGSAIGCVGSGDVTLNGASVFTNNGNGGDRGLYIYSNGNVSMADVTATNNKGNGVEINNTSNTTSTTTATVQIGGANVFTGNTGTGLAIYSKGNVGLNNVTAGANTIEGVHIENQTGTTTASVTFTGLNNFVGNTSNGVSVRSKGAITLSDVIANGSTADSGAYLRNDYTGAVGGVTLTGSNSFTGNNDYGLQILSLGAVSMNNVAADNNVLEYGAYISNAGTGASGDVTITGANNSFSGNDDYGLGIFSRGGVSLENVVANGNKTADGVNIDNATGTGNVTFTGTQTFTNNGNGDGDDGLYIRSQGNVSLADVIATGNKDEGVEIDNTPSNTRAFVSIGGTSNLFSGNTGNGLVIYSDGAIALNNVTASNNVNDSGTWLDNNQSGADSTSTVTITGTNNTFSGNNDYGLGITSRGSVSLENVATENNKTEDGVSINNSAGTGNVTLTGTNTFTNNGNDGNDDGLYVRSKGEITLIGVTATLNKDDGAELDNSETGSTSNIFVIASSFNNNTDDGLYADSNGNITLINVNAKDNLHDGVELNFPSGTNTVTICGGEYSGQYGTGAGDYDVQVNYGDTRNTNLPFSNWSPNTWGAAPICATYTDTDGDQVPDQWDTDDDNDSILDGADNCSLVSNVDQVNTDGDTEGNACDVDDDNDTLLDGVDACPIGAAAGADTDGDGCKDDVEDLDDDNDGVADVSDACPIGASTGTDTDGDGCKNTEDVDDDGDGVLDVNDAYPLDPGEWADVDGDGIGNNADLDDDNDGVLDVKDAFPLDPTESVDTDGDGTGNNADDDDDNDGHLDDKDWSPLDAGEWRRPRLQPTNLAGALLVPVTGGQGTILSCTGLSTSLEAAGFKVAFDSLCGYSADLTEVPEGGLPHALPDGQKFVGGVDVVLLQDNTSVNTLPAGAKATLSFDVPSGMTGDTLSILFWDPTSLAWVEKSLTVADGKVKLTVDQLGTFVVVEK